MELGGGRERFCGRGGGGRQPELRAAGGVAGGGGGVQEGTLVSIDRRGTRGRNGGVQSVLKETLRAGCSVAFCCN
jgi:hypothetical protein